MVSCARCTPILSSGSVAVGWGTVNITGKATKMIDIPRKASCSFLMIFQMSIIYIFTLHPVFLIPSCQCIKIACASFIGSIEISLSEGISVAPLPPPPIHPQTIIWCQNNLLTNKVTAAARNAASCLSVRRLSADAIPSFKI